MSGPEYGLLHTPSPEISEQAAIRYPSSDAPPSRVNLYQMQNHHQLPTWEVLTVDGTPNRTTGGGGAKRTHDEYSVDEFFTDVKKRRVAPSYDPCTLFVISHH